MELVSVVIPCYRQAHYLPEAIESVFAQTYRQFEIMVVDDNSGDRTGEIAVRFSTVHPGRVGVVRVPERESGRGKASALNHGYRYLRENSRFRKNPDWIIGVFDADGTPDQDMLGKASFQLRDPHVGGIQAAVRIRNRDVSWLTHMQDVEFAGFARMTQIIRTRITNSASLGGNGQFVRSAALEEIALDQDRQVYWDPHALTEDLELAARMALRNWDMYQLDTSRVWQEGVQDIRSLMKQRTRWAWGSLQVFVEYVVRMRILTTPNVRLRKRLDLLFNLSMFLVSPLVLVTWILSIVAFVGRLSVASGFPGPIMLLLSFGYFPIVGYGLLTSQGYTRRRLPLDLVGFAIYTYHWVPCLYLGLWHVVSRRAPIWWKTSRVTGRPAG